MEGTIALQNVYSQIDLETLILKAQTSVKEQLSMKMFSSHKVFQDHRNYSQTLVRTNSHKMLSYFIQCLESFQG